MKKLLIIAGSSLLILTGCANRASMGGDTSDTYISSSSGAGVDTTSSTDVGAAAAADPSWNTSKGAGARALTAPDAIIRDDSQPSLSTSAQLNTATGSAEYTDSSSATTKGAGAKALTEDDAKRSTDIAPVVTGSDSSLSVDRSSENTKGAGAQVLVASDARQGGTADTSASISSTSSSSGDLSSTDSSFVREAAQAGLAEIQMGQLTQQKAENQQLKDFGSQIAADHQKANQELMQIASQKGIQAPTAMSSSQEKMLQRLSSANGAEFDRMCEKDAVQAHEKAVRLFKNEAKNGQDTDLKAFAQKTLPTLEDHLKSARQISGNAGATSTSSSFSNGSDQK
jgi:putative membrane protein